MLLDEEVERVGPHVYLFAGAPSDMNVHVEEITLTQSLRLSADVQTTAKQQFRAFNCKGVQCRPQTERP